MVTDEDTFVVTRAQSQSAELLNVIESWAEKGIDCSELSSESLEAGFQHLEEGSADLLIAAAADVSNSPLFGPKFEVIGALPLSDWNYVLISEDRPSHLPRAGIILCENQLVRRQLRRFRPDSRVRSAKAHLGITEQERPEKLIEGDIFSFLVWAEGLRLSGEIDAYAIPRHIHRIAGLKTRRHALGHEPGENELFKFLPTPHAGTVLIIGRTGFPRSRLSEVFDDEAETSWLITETLLKSMDENLVGKVGILVRHRKPATLIREAERRRDLLVHNLLVNPEGDLTTEEVKVDIQIELVSHRGDSTLSMQRVSDLADSRIAANFLSDEWQKLIKLGTKNSAFFDL